VVWFVKMVESLFVAPVMVEAGPEEVLEPVVCCSESPMTALDWLVVARDLWSTMALRSSRLVLGGSQQLDGLHSHSGSRFGTGVRDSGGGGGDGGAQEELSEGLNGLLGLKRSELLHAIEEDGGDVTLKVATSLGAVLLDVSRDISLVDARGHRVLGSDGAFHSSSGSIVGNSKNLGVGGERKGEYQRRPNVRPRGGSDMGARVNWQALNIQTGGQTAIQGIQADNRNSQVLLLSASLSVPDA